jgi:L-alanine-DL-glutamate epimerase-like enolase superfamily enzyme
MRITEIESIILLDRIHLVRIHTDEGLTGIGEVSPMNAHVTHSIVEHALKPLLIGEEASDIERLWRRLYTKPYKLGPSGAQLNAIAGIDIALWDARPRTSRSTNSSAASTGRRRRCTRVPCRGV